MGVVGRYGTLLLCASFCGVFRKNIALDSLRAKSLVW